MKDILITGAFGGMGRATAAALAARGYRVFALDLTVGEGEENIIPVQADVTDEASVASALLTVQSYTDSLFAILHFAGIYRLNSLVEMKSADFRQILEVNLTGAYLINRTFLPLLSRGSRILITTSELADLDPLPFTGVYAVTKAALDKYAYALCMELQLLGISVSVLRAGAVGTDMLGVSMEALDRFCRETTHYTCNAARFKEIVARVEARSIAPERVADKAIKVIEKKRPAFAYSINRNPLLRLMNLLPRRLQLAVIRLVLR